MFKAVFISFSLLLSVAATASEMNLSQAMYAFGRSLRTAEMIALTAEQDPSSVTEEKIVEALSGVDAAIALAEESLMDCERLLLPAKTKDYSPEEKAAYLARAKPQMQRFLAELQEFRELLVQKNFVELEVKRKQFQETVVKAHSSL